MIGPWRFFDNPEHIFDVRGDEDAIELMAALFHDIVYVQEVDRSINFNVRYYITTVTKEVNKQLQIRDQSETKLKLNYLFALPYRHCNVIITPPQLRRALSPAIPH